MGLQIVGGKGELGKVKKQCISDQLTEVREDRVTQLSHKKFEMFFQLKAGVYGDAQVRVSGSKRITVHHVLSVHAAPVNRVRTRQTAQHALSISSCTL